MKFSHVLLTALFITTSCNDDVKLEPKKNNTIENEIKTEIKKEESTTEEVSDCLKNLKQECVAGKWKIKSIKLSPKGMALNEIKLTDKQKNQYIEVIGNKVSGKIFLVKEDEIALTDDPILFSNIDYSLFEDAGEPKIRFQINQTKIESTIKNIKNNVLTLIRAGETKVKEYTIETVWTKKQ